jgi:hypothetical protein
MFIAALFTISKLRNKPDAMQAMNEFKSVVYIQNAIILRNMKNEIMLFSCSCFKWLRRTNVTCFR